MPPTVSEGTSSRSMPNSSSSTSTSEEPASSQAPSASSSFSGWASSCSSTSSPTISSTRSSAVTMPAVPPYSSTTTAICWKRAWSSFKSCPKGLVSGTKNGGFASERAVGRGSPSGARRPRSRSRMCRMPTMWSGEAS